MKQPNDQRPGGDTNSRPIWIAVGVAVGSGVGVAIDNIALGVGIGIALGAVGAILSQRGKKSESNDS